MKLKFLAKTCEHLSCAGQNLSKGQSGEFEDSVGKSLLKNYPSDFECETPAAPESKDKDHSPKENKMAKKTAKFKSK